MEVAVVVGNPKKGSRTLEAATRVAAALPHDPPITVVDVVDLGVHLLSWGSPPVAEAIESVRRSDVVVVASPTFKATYSGILKLFLDQLPPNGLAGQVAVPLMVGAAPDHALAAELLLKPLLSELGASCPTRGLFLLESALADPAPYAAWLDEALPRIVTGVAAGVDR